MTSAFDKLPHDTLTQKRVLGKLESAGSGDNGSPSEIFDKALAEIVDIFLGSFMALVILVV